MLTKYYFGSDSGMQPLHEDEATSNSKIRPLYTDGFLDMAGISPGHVFKARDGYGLVLIGGRESLAERLRDGSSFTVSPATQGSRLAVLFSRATTKNPLRESYTIIQVIAYQPGSALATELQGRGDWVRFVRAEPTEVTNGTLYSRLQDHLK
jgi:hypothetical protein